MLRRKRRVRISQRTTLAHWFNRMGKSRQDWIHLLYVSQMIVSLVGRTIKFSSNFESGSGIKPAPSSEILSLEWVTTAHSFANPSTCSASFDRNDSGIKSGKYAFWWPVSFNMPSSALRRFSQSAYPLGANDHRSTNGGIIGQLRAPDDVDVPLGVVFRTGL